MTPDASAARSPLDNPYLLGGVTGIAFVILMLAGIVVSGDAPMIGDNINDAHKFFENDANQYLVGDWMSLSAAFLLFLPFVCQLRAILASVDRTGTWSRLTVVGAITFVAVAAASAAAFGATAQVKGEGIDDSTLRLVLAMNTYGFTSAGLGMAVMLLGASVVIGRSGILWRWLAIFGAIGTPLLVLGVLADLEHTDQGIFSFLGLLGLVATLFFILLSSICMLVRRAAVASLPSHQAH